MSTQLRRTKEKGPPKKAFQINNIFWLPDLGSNWKLVGLSAQQDAESCLLKVAVTGHDINNVVCSGDFHVGTVGQAPRLVHAAGVKRFAGAHVLFCNVNDPPLR